MKLGFARALAGIVLLVAPLDQACSKHGHAQPPGPFQLTSPAMGAAGIATSGYTLTWTGSFGAATYTLEFSANNRFSPVLSSVQVFGTSAAPAFTLPASATVWWRVWAVNDAGSVLATGAPAVFSTQGPTPAVSPVVGTLVDLAVDPLRNRVYATNSTADTVEILDVATETLLSPLTLPAASQPSGLDVSPDGTRLLVCLHGSSQIAVIDLTSNPPVLSTTLPVAADFLGTTQPDSIACTSNGRAFFTCSAGGSGFTVPRQIDLTQASLPITLRSDVPGGDSSFPTSIAASRDRKSLLFSEGDDSGGPFYFYSASGDSFSIKGSLSQFNGAAAANDDGSLCCISGTSFVEPSVRLRAVVPVAGLGTASGLAFAPGNLRAYRGVSGAPTIEILDLSRDLVVAAITTPANLLGKLIVNDTGSLLFAIAQGGILVQPLGMNHAPVVEPQGTVVVNAGESVGVTIQGQDPDGDELTWTAAPLPIHAAFDPATRRLTFSPDASQVGALPAVQIQATDGLLASTATVNFVVTAPASYPLRKLPVNGTLGELAADAVRGRLYVSNTTMNRVEVVDIATSTLLDPIAAGSAPIGLDLDVTAARLVVCPSGSEYIQVFDLTQDPPVLASSLAVPSSTLLDMRRPAEVAVAASGHAFFDTVWPGSGWSVVRDLTLSTGSIALRSDVGIGGEVTASSLGSTFFRASGDRSRIVLGEPNISSGPIILYTSATDHFTSELDTSSFITSVDANADGSLFLLSEGGDPGTRMLDSTPTPVGSIPGTSKFVAFRQGTSTGFQHAQTSTVSVIDPASASVTDSFVLPEAASGRMRTDPAGKRLFVITQTGIAIVTLP